MRALLALALIAGPAGALELVSPVDCSAVGGCYIQSYADRDPGPGAADFTCGALSYDGHNGTDFRVATFADLGVGVPVRAAAPGRVRAVRDGEPETGVAGATEARACGNGVAITHEDGWETQYCHMAKGGVAVRAGERVEAGQVIGRMGFSGKTEFPHLHLTLRRDGAPVDPFDARPVAAACGAGGADNLWSAAARSEFAYRPGGIVDHGFTAAPPKLADVRQGEVGPAPAPGAAALVFWGRAYGLSEGDELRLRLVGPGGAILASSETPMPRNRAEQFQFVGKRTPPGGWPAGRYRGEFEIWRNGRLYEAAETTLALGG